MSPRCDSVAALYCLQNSMMFTPCWPSAGPTGGAGVARPALICSLMIADSFFLGGMSFPLLRAGGAGLLGEPRPSDLGDVGEVELDRCLAAEDRHQHLELLGVDVDLVDGRRQGGERPLDLGDRLARLEVDDLGLDLDR